MKRLRKLAAVDDDVAAIVEYLLSHEASRAARQFYRMVRRAFGLVHAHPHTAPAYLGDTRKLLVSGLRNDMKDRYAVVYRETETEVIILAVADLRRRPGYWRGRR